MASLSATIQLHDNFSDILYGIVNAVNLGMSAMEEMQQAMDASVDTSSLQGARDEINNVTAAIHQMKAAWEVPGQKDTIRVPVKMDFAGELSQPADQEVVTRQKVEWQSDDLPVFTGTGIERYQQEIQNTNQMLARLAEVQGNITEQAAGIDVIPPGMAEDLNAMANRINAIRTRIAAIEKNPLNIGTDEANAELEQLRGQLNQAVQAQQSLNQAVANMDVSGANDAYLRLSNTISSTERYIRDNVDEQGKFNRELAGGTSEANKLMGAIKGAVASYLTIQSIGKVIGLSDTMASSQAKINIMLDTMGDKLTTTKQIQDMVYLSAERSRGSYQDTLDTVAKLGNLASDAFKSPQETIAFAEQLNKQFRLAGASTSEMQNATLQLTQALASGVLRGDELNSVFEQAPTIIQAIANYMGKPMGEIRKLASEGEITASIVKNAMFAAADETNAKFESMPMTFAQIWQSIQNTAMMAFQPILEKINAIANSPEFEEFIQNVCNSLAFLGNVASEVFDVIIVMVNAMARAWPVIGPLIMGAATALAVYYGWQKASAIMHTIVAAAQMLHAAMTGKLTAATAETIAVQLGLNAALYACPVTWIVMAIILLIAVLAAAGGAMGLFGSKSQSVTGAVMGAFAVMAAFIGNIVIVAINHIIDNFVRLWNFVAMFANFFANVFTDPIGAAARLFFGFVDMILSLIQTVASAIDTVFGTGLADGVAGWRSSLDGWVTDKFGEGKVVMETQNANDYHLDRLEYGAAWEKGNSFGDSLSMADYSGNIPNAGEYGEFDYSSFLTDIEGNTEDIKDGMELSEEDLKYLRDIAEQETVNRFTTAQITIEQTNHNSISSTMDLDGIVTGLTDAVNEAADIATEGVHM